MKKNFLFFWAIVLLMSCDYSDYSDYSDYIDYSDLELRNLTLYDVSYGSHREQKMDILIPDTEGPYPVMVMIHGGSWHWGDKADQNYASILYRSKGYAVFNINYRLGEDPDFFSMDDKIDDIEMALDYIYSLKKQMNLNEKLTLLGSSAGGHLSLLYGYGRGKNIVDAVISYSGPTDLLNPQYQENGLAMYIEYCFPDVPPENREQIYREYSPIHMIAQDLPPTLLIHGTEDTTVPFEESNNLSKALLAQGVAVYILPIAGVGHAFEDADWTYAEQVTEDFIKEYSR